MTFLDREPSRRRVGRGQGRTYIVLAFPNPASYVRFVWALATEIRDSWIEVDCYLDMELLEQHKRERRRALADYPCNL